MFVSSKFRGRKNGLEYDTNMNKKKTLTQNQLTIMTMSSNMNESSKLIMFFLCISICRELTDRLVTLVKTSLLNLQDRSWLCCIPVLHYLKGRYKPFQKAPSDANHSNAVPVWWGVDILDSNLKYFKGKAPVLRFCILLYTC